MIINKEFIAGLGDVSNNVLILLQTKLVRPTALHNDSRSEVYFNFTALDTLIFVALEGHKQLTMTQLAHQLGVSNQRLTRPVNKLVTAGYLRRIFDENNRRIIKVCTTEKLDRVSDSYNSRLDEYVADSLSVLTGEELNTLNNCLMKLKTILTKLK